MRELERLSLETTIPAAPTSLGLVGRGRLGHAMARALTAAGCEVDGPAGRGQAPRGEAILLCVPDREIEAAAAAVAGTAALVGHTSGAVGLAALAPARAVAFALHPLMTVPEADGVQFRGAGAAIGGTTPAAVQAAASIARRLGMSPFELADADRPAYHAAASIASNFLVSLEWTAEELLVQAGVGAERARGLLAPLVRATVESWAQLGAREALTGPIARGDDATVAVQREAVARLAPQSLAVFDALAEQTRALAARGEAVVA